MVLVQKWPFIQLFFLGNIRHENIFYDIRKRKNAFLGYSNKKFKKSKNWHFSIVLVQKWPFFQTLFLAIIGKENVFRHILEQKKAFLGYKNQKLKKSKNWHFSKGVNPCMALVQKRQFFQTFFFRQYRPGKCLLQYYTTKNLLSRL